MAYKRDWLEVNPINHTKFSVQPGNVRAHKVDISDRLKGMFKGFVTGETQTDEGIINLPFNVQGSDPGASTSKVKVYSKDVSAKAELFVQDEDADVIQLTDGGVLKALTIIYPVGSIYITTVVTNPATVLGFGTWSTFGAGKVLVSLDTGDTDFDTSEETGGAKTHQHTAGTLSVAAHDHGSKTGGVSQEGSPSQIAGGSAVPHVHSIPQQAAATPTGSVAAGSGVQPYIVVYMFKRTA